MKYRNEVDVDDEDDENYLEKPYVLKAPEGCELDAAMLKTFTPQFRDLGLSNSEVQRLLDAHAKHEKSKRDAWFEATLADKEIGGKNFESAKANAVRVVSEFATPEFINLMDQTGIGDHPEVIRLCARIGDALPAKKTGPGEVSKAEAAKKLYPNSDMN